MSTSYEEFQAMCRSTQLYTLNTELLYRLYEKIRGANAEELVGLADKVIELIKVDRMY